MTNEQQQLEKILETPQQEQEAFSVPQSEPTAQPEAVTSDDQSNLGEDEEGSTASETPQEESSPEQVITALMQQVEELQKTLVDQNQQFELLKSSQIRLTAEFDNYRKRTAKEKQELETQIKCRTISELLSVVDNFERARSQIKPANDGEGTIHKSYQGVYKNLVDSLKRLGVSPMRPEGELFDPLYHEAMLREYTDEYPEGTIIEELMRGYMLGEQVLRHAMVKVATPKPSEGTSEEEGTAEPSPSAD